MAKQTTLLVALLAGCASMLPGADAAECPNTAGVVFGSIFGTLAVVAIIAALVYCCCIKKKRESRDITAPKSGSKHGQTNPSFVADVETGSTKPVCDDKQHKELGFGGYVVCREYEGKPTPLPAVISSPVKSHLKQKLPFPLQRGSSSGSLDNGVPLSNTELVSVVLQSEDIVGLGFNITGSMRDGIFVSQVLNRGPASESGLVEAGDRIISVTISFENMVYEDALTILSYASPYPVKLHLQKPITTSPHPTDPRTFDDVLNHPVLSNRSQSLDDLRLIGKENIVHPYHSRSYSVMKRRVARNDDDADDVDLDGGLLRKWAGKQDVMTGESSETGDRTTQSSNSNYSMDTKNDVDGRGEFSHSLGIHGERSQDRTDAEARVVNSAVNVEHADENVTMAEVFGDMTESDKEDVIRLTYEDHNHSGGSRHSSMSGDSLDQRRNTGQLASGDVILNLNDPRLYPESDDDLDGHVYHDSPRDVAAGHLLLSSDRQLVSGSPSSLDVVIPFDREGQVEVSDVSPREETVDVESTTSLDGELLSLDVDIPLHTQFDTGSIDMNIPSVSTDDTYLIPLSQAPLCENDISDKVSLNAEVNTVEIGSSISSLLSTKGEETSDIQKADINDNKIIVVDHTEEVLASSYDIGPPSSLAPPAPPGAGEITITSDNGYHVGEPEETVLIQDDSTLTLEEAPLNVQQTDDESSSILKEYFGDKPSLLEQFGFSGSQDSETYVTTEKELRTVTKDGTVVRTETSTTRMTSQSPEVIPPLTEPQHVTILSSRSRRSSSSSSNSSRSSSCPPRTDQSYESSVSMTSPSTKTKSSSPEIRRRSTGGLSFDITAHEFSELPTQVEPEPRGEPKGGIAYYVRIDDQMNASPAERVYEIDKYGALQAKPISDD